MSSDGRISARARQDVGVSVIEISGSDAAVCVQPGDTLLAASLRAGVKMPHLCMVGECGSCRCRLLQGKVRLRRDISHHVDAEALRRGYLLACQSEALGDVRLAVPGLSSEFEGQPVRTVAGRILSAAPLNHDIRQLVVSLDEPIEYRAGQYAQISVPGHAVLAEAPRCYSFATAPVGGPTTQVQFHTRRVPGGAFSEWLFADDRVGQSIQLTGPLGDFGFHEDGRPMVCVAGGSGLAPIKAILEALSVGVNAPDVTLFFAARTQADLYCLDELTSLADRWPGPGRLLMTPVLSLEPEGSDWGGLRGYCAEHLEQFCNLSASSFYVCGPPVLIDTIIDKLGPTADAGRVYYDRFLDRSNMGADAA